MAACPIWKRLRPAIEARAFEDPAHGICGQYGKGCSRYSPARSRLARRRQVAAGNSLRTAVTNGAGTTLPPIQLKSFADQPETTKADCSQDLRRQSEQHVEAGVFGLKGRVLLHIFFLGLHLGNVLNFF